MSEQFNAVWKPPTMAELQDRIKELNDLVDLLRTQMRDQNMRTRDHFAGAALTGMMFDVRNDVTKRNEIAILAYIYADAMMDRRAKDRP